MESDSRACVVIVWHAKRQVSTGASGHLKPAARNGRPCRACRLHYCRPSGKSEPNKGARHHSRRAERRPMRKNASAAATIAAASRRRCTPDLLALPRLYSSSCVNKSGRAVFHGAPSTARRPRVAAESARSWSARW